MVKSWWFSVFLYIHCSYADYKKRPHHKIMADIPLKPGMKCIIHRVHVSGNGYVDPVRLSATFTRCWKSRLNSTLVTNDPSGSEISVDRFPSDILTFSYYVHLHSIAQANIYLNRIHLCSGSIIAKQWILTAAHCLVEEGILYKLNGLEIVVGSIYDEDGNGDAYRVIKSLPHPQYRTSKNIGFDIALLETNPISFSHRILAIKMLRKQIIVDEWASVIGFGQTSEASRAFSVLVKTDLRIDNDNKKCQRKQYHLEDEFCASQPKNYVSSHHKDGGRPMIFGRYLVGVTSLAGHKYHIRHHTTYFTNVTFHMEWIRNMISRGV